MDNQQILTRLTASRYLSNLLVHHPELNKDIERPPLEALSQTYKQLAELDDFHNRDKIEQALIKSKAMFAFNWSLAEFSDAGDFDQRGQWQTKFAELTIDIALRCAWAEVAKKQPAVRKALEINPAGMPGLFVFGMGKLGGGDLNFSSDVDLVAYFDPQVLPVPEVLGKAFICHQVLQKATQMLAQNGSSKFIWRVDWRLRPNASASTLAMSTEAAEEYYYFRASPWHRLALMKARVVAGDQQAGHIFLETITPFIWRQNLDFRALDELAEIKQKINLEHPALRVERQWRDPINDEIGGFNVKLGSGGIREIEFIANALQLVWGGRHYELRTPNTIEALTELSRLGQIEEALGQRLIQSYQFLRRIENAIQIMANQHSHLIPEDPIAQKNLAILLAEPDWQALIEKLNSHRIIVSDHFESMFAEHSEQLEFDLVWPADLSAKAEEIVEGWEKGFHQYGVSVEMRPRLKPLSKALADYLQAADRRDAEVFDISTMVLRVHDFFRALPQGEQYFRLLAESPNLLDSIIPPLLYSPVMTTLLRQSPHIIDCFMGNIGLDLNADFDSDYVLQADNYERRLERMRRFVNECLFQLYLLFMRGELSVEAFQKALSDLAIHTLELALRVVSEQLQLPASPITVLGMGKVALGRMSPMSDLDLIFIFDPQKTSLELASKFVSRLQTAISTPMREGVVYDLDTRLRPSGRSGAPTVSIDSFAEHQLKRAHTWEHIALVPSKVVAGDRSLEAAINKIKHQVLNDPRDRQQFLRDAYKMWQRVADNRLKEFSADVMFSKLRPGGLMQGEYLSACLILSTPSATSAVDFESLLTEAVRNTDMQNMSKILQFWRIQQLWERLLGFTEQSLENLPKPYLAVLLDHSKVTSLAELLTEKHRYAQRVLEACEVLFADIEESDFNVEAWHETNVQWLDSISNNVN